MGYTKGDWKVNYEGEVGRAGSRIYVVGADGFAIARIADKEEREANAHLIAAAPDMYEALKKVFIRQAVENRRVVERGMPSSEEVIEIQSALTKAEGK